MTGLNPDSFRRLHGVVRQERDREFGRAAVRLGLLTESQLEAARAGGGDSLEAFLLQRGWLRREQVSRVWAEVDSGTAGGVEGASIPIEVRRAAAAAANLLKEFVLVERLGRGGGGEVWKAWDTRLARWVAVKLPGLQKSDTAWARFRREASAAARLSHPGIVGVFRVDEDLGRPFLVMAHVEGKSLEGWKPGPMEAAKAVLQAAVAVEHAHSHGIVHRDLKPGNLMQDRSGRVVILDFGLASLLEESRRLTAEGQAVGTPMYMAPEQAAGRPESRRPTVDVYGLGVTLYELATGRPPFTGRTYAELMTQIASGEPRRPRTVAPDAPPDLERVILRAMEKEPSQRYPTAGAMAEDLRRFLAGEPVSVRGGSSIRRMFRCAVRQRAVLVVVLAAAGLGGWWAVEALTRSARAERAVREARAAEDRGDLEAALHHWRNAQRRGDVDRIEAELARRRGEAQRLAAEAEANARLAQVRAVADRAQGVHYQARPDFAALRETCERALKQVESILKDAPGLAEGHVVAARLWHLLGHDDRALERLDEAVRLDPDHGPAHFLAGRIRFQEAVRVMLRLSWEHHPDPFGAARRWSDPAAASLTRALASSASLAGPLEERLARVIVTYFGTDEAAVGPVVAEAEREFRGRQGSEDFLLLLSLTERGEGRLARAEEGLAVKPYDELLLFVRAMTLNDLGRRAEAVAAADRVLDAAPRSPIGWLARAEFRLGAGDFERSSEAYATLARVSPAFESMAEAQRAEILAKTGREREAEAAFTQGLARFPKEPLFHLYYANLLRRRAERTAREKGRAAAEGDYAAAVREYTEAIVLDPFAAAALLNRGSSRIGMGHLPQAAADFRAAVRIRPRYGLAWLNLVLTLRQLHRDDEAEAAGREALRVLAPEDPARAQIEKALQAE